MWSRSEEGSEVAGRLSASFSRLPEENPSHDQSGEVGRRDSRGGVDGEPFPPDAVAVEHAAHRRSLPARLVAGAPRQVAAELATEPNQLGKRATKAVARLFAAETEALSNSGSFHDIILFLLLFVISHRPPTDQHRISTACLLAHLSTVSFVGEENV